MTDTAKVLHEIAKLYAQPKKDQPLSDAVLEMEEKLNARFDDYNKAFQGMYTANLIKAVDDYWRYKSDKVRPTIAQIVAMHESDDKKKIDESEEHQDLRRRILKCADEHGDKWGAVARERYLRLARQQWPDVDLSGHEWTEPKVLGCAKQARTDYAADFMARDIRQGRCRHLLPVYNRAVRLVAEDRLSREIPASEWAKLSFAERCEKAMAIGLFNDFDNALIEACRSYCGKDYQLEANLPKVNPNRAGGYIAAHYADNDIFDLSEGA